MKPLYVCCFKYYICPMELDENNVPEEQYGDYVEIYSRKAIFWFSALGSPLFGGVLLAYNLNAAGYKKAIYWVGIFTVLFTVITNIAVYQYIFLNKVNINVNFRSTTVDPKLVILAFMSLGLRIIGGLILTQYFSKKYFPEDDYYPKSIFSALFATVFILIVFSFIGYALQV